MLCLSRKVGEKIVIGRLIEVEIVEVRGGNVRLGVTAPREIEVHREEVFEAIQAREQDAA